MRNSLKENLAEAGVGGVDDPYLEPVVTHRVAFPLCTSGGCRYVVCACLFMNGHVLS